ncbi:hypothetical protein ABZ832_22250 [Streptantibioticus parmotrematis]|uniref:hypothetical protein n=1 Tax=Streptantibioticus parmotrematis TaxID=2873249 RepID=UPI0033C734A9
MAREFDSQLLESVAVRRRRMRDALVYGASRSRRSTGENLGRAFGGVALAAVLCAGCVGWSFVSHHLLHASTAAPASAPSIMPTTPTGSPATR